MTSLRRAGERDHFVLERLLHGPQAQRNQRTYQRQGTLWWSSARSVAAGDGDNWCFAAGIPSLPMGGVL